MQKEGRVKKLEFFSHVLPFLISNVRHHKFPLQPPAYKQVL